MNPVMPFDEALSAVDSLPPDQQEELVGIIRRRLAALGRARVLQDVHDADTEFMAGRCSPVSVDDLMREILS